MVSTYGIVPKRTNLPPLEKPTPVPSPAKAAARAKQSPPNRRNPVTGLTPKQEAFVDALLRLGDPVRAYRSAYGAERMSDSNVYLNARRLIEHPRIQPLIEEARESARMARGYTVDDALREAEEARALAMSTDTPAAAVSAVNLKAKLLGLIVDKKEVTQKYEEMSPEQLEQRLQEMASRLGFELPDATTLRARLAPPDPKILDADFTEVREPTPADSTPADRAGEGER